jgi:hypothetical protein
VSVTDDAISNMGEFLASVTSRKNAEAEAVVLTHIPAAHDSALLSLTKQHSENTDTTAVQSQPTESEACHHTVGAMDDSTSTSSNTKMARGTIDTCAIDDADKAALCASKTFDPSVFDNLTWDVEVSMCTILQ